MRDSEWKKRRWKEKRRERQKARNYGIKNAEEKVEARRNGRNERRADLF